MDLGLRRFLYAYYSNDINIDRVLADIIFSEIYKKQEI